MGIIEEDHKLSKRILEMYAESALEALRETPTFLPSIRDPNWVPPSKWTMKRRRWTIWWKKLPTYRLHAAGECPRDPWD